MEQVLVVIFTIVIKKMIGKIGSRWSLVVLSSIIRKLNFVSKRWKGKNSPGFF